MGDVKNYIKDKQSNIDKVKKIKSDIKSYRNHSSRWRKEAKLDYDFYAGCQWSEEDKALMESQSRIPVVFNRIARTINGVTGLELQNRQDINLIPVGVEDSGVTDLANSAMKYVRNETNSEDEESEIYEDLLICGLGASYTYIDYEKDIDGKVCQQRVDPFLVAFDPTAKSKNIEDSRWRAVAIKYKKTEIANIYPEIEDYENAGVSLFENGESEYSKSLSDDYGEGDAKEDESKNLVEAIYYQYYKLEPVYRLLDTDGQLKNLNQAEYNAIKDTLNVLGVQKVIPQKRRVYYQCLIVGDILLEEKEAPIQKFSIEVLTGLRDRNRNTWFGLVRIMRDPQMWANKWLSQIMYILGTNAKGGYFYETGTFANINEAENNIARPDKNVELNPNMLDRVRLKDQPRYPDGIDRLLQYAISSINDTSGVSVELLGLTGREQAGVVESSRKNAGITVLATFTNSLRRFRKSQGGVLLDFIRKYISDGRLIRIDGANAKYIPLLKSGFAEKYDIVVDDAPTSSNMKERIFTILMQVLPMAMQAGVPIPPDLLDYMPLPEALISKWKAYIDGQQVNPDAEMAKEIAVIEKTIDIEKKKSEIGLNKARTIKEISQAESGSVSSIEDNLLNLESEKVKNDTAKIKATADITKEQLKQQTEKTKLANKIINQPITL